MVPEWPHSWPRARDSWLQTVVRPADIYHYRFLQRPSCGNLFAEMPMWYLWRSSENALLFNFWIWKTPRALLRPLVQQHLNCRVGQFSAQRSRRSSPMHVAGCFSILTLSGVSLGVLVSSACIGLSRFDCVALPRACDRCRKLRCCVVNWGFAIRWSICIV